jgi:hypothetical protein
MTACAHVWPAELEPDAGCTSCGLEYGEYSEEGESE